jgi:hypothetical protein
MTLVLSGPLSSATPEGPLHLGSWFILGVGCLMLSEEWVTYVKHRQDAEVRVLDLVGTTILSLFCIGLGTLGVLGMPPVVRPLFAAPDGMGLVFSVLFLVMGGWILARAWVEYVKRRDTSVSAFVLVLANIVSLLFIVAGAKGVARWFVGRVGG